ncbi:MULTISPECIES: hypothetical protein [Nocardia]|uniref:hypothetical protein n=1 Tax=Nocardia TaxID=1817 RepID=UPI002E2AC531|nr:hypothetical protein [Nocardia salmonicida]
MALKDMWLTTDFHTAFPMGVMLLGKVEAVTEFNADRNAPKRHQLDFDREGNGTGKRLWKATITDPTGSNARQTTFDIVFVADQMPTPSADEVAPGFRPIVLEGLMLKPKIVGNGEFKSIGWNVRATGIAGDNSGAKVNNRAADKAA